MSTTENLIIEIITTIDPRQCVDTINRATGKTIEFTTIDNEQKTLTLTKDWDETINALLKGEDPEGTITTTEPAFEVIGASLRHNPEDGIGKASSTLTLSLNGFMKDVEIPVELPQGYPVYQILAQPADILKLLRESAQLVKDGADEFELYRKDHELQLAVWRAVGVIN